MAEVLAVNKRCCFLFKKLLFSSSLPLLASDVRDASFDNLLVLSWRSLTEESGLSLTLMAVDCRDVDVLDMTWFLPGLLDSFEFLLRNFG